MRTARCAHRAGVPWQTRAAKDREKRRVGLMRWRGSCRIAVVLAGLTVLMLTSLITAGGALADSLSQSEIKLLKSILPHIKYVESGVGGKPTIRFSGVNVQVVNGEGETGAPVNGEGNLVIGYD